MVYNLVQHSKNGKLGNVYNKGRGSYVKLHEKIDNGNWGVNMKVCDAEKDGQAIT